MKTDVKRRVKALQRKLARDLEMARKNAFIAYASTVAIAYFVGELEPGEDLMDAYLRGLEHDSLETLCRDLAQVVKTGSSELQLRLGRAVCKLFKRFNLGGEKLPPDHAGYYEPMLKIVNHLPEEWRDWIDEAVDEAVETKQQTKKIFREVEKLTGVRFA
jgi:5'-deoxynucleotidase YfbR-like HD superfamily hydrolase